MDAKLDCKIQKAWTKLEKALDKLADALSQEDSWEGIAIKNHLEKIDEKLLTLKDRYMITQFPRRG